MNSSRTLPQITKSYQFPLLNICLVSFIFLILSLAQTQSSLGYIAIIVLVLIYFLTFPSWSLTPYFIIKHTNLSHSLAAGPCHVQDKGPFKMAAVSVFYLMVTPTLFTGISVRKAIVDPLIWHVFSFHFSVFWGHCVSVLSLLPGILWLCLPLSQLSTPYFPWPVVRHLWVSA